MARVLIGLALGFRVASAQTPVPESSPAGTPWIGAAAVQETTAQLAARAALGQGRAPAFRRWPLRRKPASPPQQLTTLSPGSATASAPSLQTVQTLGVNFTAATLYDAAGFPPDSMGAAGPTQYILAINGRIRSFSKSSGAADGAINIDTSSFFSSVMTPSSTGNFTTDPRIRYDRLSGRWFLTMIDVPGGQAQVPNRVMIAVSDSGTIAAGTAWSFYQFQQDTVAPAGDTGYFADYPTLGIDANALYIGVNLFNSSGSFINSTGFVVRKSSLLNGGPIVVTAFRDLIVSKGPFNKGGPYTPQGVDNYDPAATEGYFIGVDVNSMSTLQLRRVSNPSGSPSISGNISISVPTFSNPISVPHRGNTGGSSGNLDAGDNRLLCAHLRNGQLWTSHTIGVDNTGAATGTITRDGVRWYALSGIASGQTPGVAQAGTLYQPSSANTTDQRSYWMGSIQVSGQGHVALGCSTAGANNYVDAATTGRLAGDPANSLGTPVNYTASSYSYNPVSDPGGSQGRRWGDYSYTSLDPADDMTLWTVQEFCSSTDVYGVQVVKLLAPAPALPNSCAPASAAPGTANLSVVLTGTPAGGAGFFEPGASFPNHLTASVNGGGVTINSITYNNPTNLTVNLTVAASATVGARTITVTNPDGQSAVSTAGIFTVNAPVTNRPPTLASIANQTLHALETLVLTNSATDPDLPAQSLTYSLGAATPAGVTIGATSGVLAWTPTDSQVGTTNITVCVTDNGVPPLSQTQTFTVSVLPRPKTTISTSVGAVALTWSAIAGTTYLVQSKTNLNQATWTDLSPDIVASGSTASLTITTAGTNGARFYRVQVIQ